MEIVILGELLVESLTYLPREEVSLLGFADRALIQCLELLEFLRSLVLDYDNLPAPDLSRLQGCDHILVVEPLLEYLRTFVRPELAFIDLGPHG